MKSFEINLSCICCEVWAEDKQESECGAWLLQGMHQEVRVDFRMVVIALLRTEVITLF